MTVITLTVLVFLICLGFTVSGLYFLFEAPAARKKFRLRLTTVQQLLSTPSSAAATSLLRERDFSEIPTFNRILQYVPFMPQLQSFLYQAGVEMSVGTLLMICFSLAVFGFLGGLLANLPAWMALMVAAGAGAVPFMVVSFKRNRRLSRFEELFPDAIDLLARAVRAGHAFTTGFELISREMPEPLASEFQITYEQQNLGMPLRDALNNLTTRVPLPDVRFFVSALQIQRESGGNLAEILDKLSYVIRERFKILRQVRVYTAEGRVSLYILTAVPPATAAMMYLVNRDYIMTLFQDPIGHKIVATAVFLQVAGYFVIRKITQLKV